MKNYSNPSIYSWSCHEPWPDWAPLTPPLHARLGMALEGMAGLGMAEVGIVGLGMAELGIVGLGMAELGMVGE